MKRLREISWLQWVCRRLDYVQSGDQLVIDRRWQPYGAVLLLYCLMVALMAWGSCDRSVLRVLERHIRHALLFLHGIEALLMILPVITAHRLTLRRRRFVLDRRHDYVTCNGFVLCALSEVQSIRVGRPYGDEGDMRALELILHDRNEVPIDRTGLFGVGQDDLGQAGLALSDFARVPLWAEGVWHDPRVPIDTPPWLSSRSLPSYRIARRIRTFESDQR